MPHEHLPTLLPNCPGNTALATGSRPHLRAAVKTDGSWQCAVNVRARSDGPETLPGGLKRVALAYGVLHHCLLVFDRLS
jgi:hypothetical protein